MSQLNLQASDIVAATNVLAKLLARSDKALAESIRGGNRYATVIEITDDDSIRLFFWKQKQTISFKTDADAIDEFLLKVPDTVIKEADEIDQEIEEQMAGEGEDTATGCPACERPPSPIALSQWTIHNFLMAQASMRGPGEDWKTARELSEEESKLYHTAMDVIKGYLLASGKVQKDNSALPETTAEN